MKEPHVSICLLLLYRLPSSIPSIVVDVNIVLDHFHDDCLKVVETNLKTHARTVIQDEIRHSLEVIQRLYLL